ncbi:MAG: hypothetical protein JNK46_18145 [Methylobacteriaceae bacterium]|nr:hypothetical protein [Methylobacteriaceae bacterium]
MSANRHANIFWRDFIAARASIEARLAAAAPARGPTPYPVMRAYFADVVDALAAYDPALTPEIERAPSGAWRLVVSADGAAESFASARDLIAAAPAIDGWRLEALRPRRAPPARIDGPGVSIELSRLRFAYGLANDRMVAMLLIEGRMPADRHEAQFLARRLVADLLGEADEATWIADTRLVSYEDWLAITPGGRSWPIGELASRFDAIFHPAPRAPAELTEAAGPVAAEEDMALCA